jgi:hypothetical protein
MSHDASVLLLSHRSEPFCTARVAGALAARGARVLRLDTDAFPSQIRLSGQLASSASQPAPRLLYQGEPLHVDAVWLWRLWPAALDERIPDAQRKAAQRESLTTLHGFLDLLGEAFFIDPPDAMAAGENKTRQLRLAQALGLAIPPTLITCDPGEARAFYAAQSGRVVAKLQTSLGYSMHGGGGLPTRRLQVADLDALSGLSVCPMVFQRYIDKAYELRVAWVDGEAFVGALDGSRCGTDWRYESTASWQPHALPQEIHRKLDALMRQLGLRQGALDLIVTPSGEYVFLEVNPHGEWGMLERDLGLPIGAALADALLRRGSRTKGQRS